MVKRHVLVSGGAALALCVASAPAAADADEDRGFFGGEFGPGDSDRHAAVVWKAEQALAAKGFDPGIVDGRFTERTEEALTRFQRERGLEADGKLSDGTLAALGVAKGYGGTAGLEVGPFGASGNLSAGRSGVGSGGRLGVGPLETGAQGYVGPFGGGGGVDLTVAGVGLGAQAEASTYQIGAALNVYTRAHEPQQLGLSVNPPFVGRNGTGIDVSIPFVGKQGVGLGQDTPRVQVDADTSEHASAESDDRP